MKLIIVDLDGTLFDTREVNYLAYREAMQSFGYKLERKHYYQCCNGRHYLDFLPELTTDDLEILSQIHEMKKICYRKYLNTAILNKGLVTLLKICKRTCKIALVTTASKDNTSDILNYFELAQFFDLILTGDDVNQKKPNPEGFLRAMEDFGVTAGDSIVFEDSEEGIQAAISAGIPCFAAIGFH